MYLSGLSKEFDKDRILGRKSTARPHHNGLRQAAHNLVGRGGGEKGAIWKQLTNCVCVMGGEGGGRV